MVEQIINIRKPIYFLFNKSFWGIGQNVNKYLDIEENNINEIKEDNLNKQNKNNDIILNVKNQNEFRNDDGKKEKEKIFKT